MSRFEPLAWREYRHGLHDQDKKIADLATAHVPLPPTVASVQWVTYDTTPSQHVQTSPPGFHDVPEQSNFSSGQVAISGRKDATPTPSCVTPMSTFDTSDEIIERVDAARAVGSLTKWVTPGAGVVPFIQLTQEGYSHLEAATKAGRNPSTLRNDAATFGAKARQLLRSDKAAGILGQIQE